MTTNKQIKSLLVLLLALFLAIPSLNAQHLRVDFRPAFSIPLGDFAAKSLDGGSFALAGFSGELGLQMEIKSGFSVRIQVAAARHSIDVSALGYERVKQDPFLEDVYIRSEAFSNNMLLAGPIYELRFSEKISLEGGLLAGLAQSQTPYQLYKPKYFLTGPPFYEITTATDYSFIWGASAALMVDFGRCYQLGFSTEWLQANPVFTFNTASGLRQDKRRISMLNLGLVFSVKLF